jgi:hypothetical protein
MSYDVFVMTTCAHKRFLQRFDVEETCDATSFFGIPVYVYATEQEARRAAREFVLQGKRVGFFLQ